MLKLLRLEFLFCRRPILITLAIFAGYFAYIAHKVRSPRLFLIMTCIMVGLSMPFIMIGRDDKFKTAGLVCSLPVRRSTIVLSKYAASWALILLGMVYALVLAAALPFSRLPVGEILNPGSIMAALALISAVFSFVIPVTTRFGLPGIIILLVVSQLLGVLLMVLRMVLGPKLDLFRTVFRALEGGIRSLLHHPPTAGFLLSLAAAVVALNAVSFLITRALYARKEL